MTRQQEYRHATLRGEHEFLLKRRPDGLFMRRKTAAEGAAVDHSILFATEAEFVAWCEDDPVLRRHPLLDSEVRRSGLDLLAVD